MTLAMYYWKYMMANKETTTTHFPLFSILGLIFITLKLTGYIAWSWWWVLAPFWVPIVVALALFVVGYFLLWVNEK